MSLRAIAGFLLYACLAGSATASLSIVGNVDTPSTNQNDIVTDMLAPADQGFIKLDMATTGWYFNAGVYGYAAPGVLKVEAFSSASHPESTGRSSADVTAIWSFTAKMTKEGLEGTPGRMTFSHLYDFTASGYTYPFGPSVTEQMATSEGEFGAYFSARTSLGDSTSEYSLTQWSNNLGYLTTTVSQQTSDAMGEDELITPGRQELTIDFIWGETVQFMQAISARCVAVDSGPEGIGYCNVDATHSSYWGGITEVLAGGEVVDDYVIETAELIDLRHSMAPASQVPEPHAWHLFVLAGALFAARRHFGR